MASGWCDNCAPWVWASEESEVGALTSTLEELEAEGARLEEAAESAEEGLLGLESRERRVRLDGEVAALVRAEALRLLNSALLSAPQLHPAAPAGAKGAAILAEWTAAEKARLHADDRRREERDAAAAKARAAQLQHDITEYRQRLAHKLAAIAKLSHQLDRLPGTN